MPAPGARDDLSGEQEPALPPDISPPSRVSAPGPARSPLPRLARCFFAFLGVLPWALPLARSRLPLGALGAALDRLFLSMCHRIPERSLAIGGVMMPVCSRCAGIFAGLAVGAVIARPNLSMAVWRPLLVALGALMALDVLTQDLGVHPVSHPARLATGFALGYGMVTAFVTHLVCPRS